MQKTDQIVFRNKKVIKRKDDKLCIKWKDYDNLFSNWTDKKRYCCIKMSYFSPYGHNKNKIKVKLGLFNHAVKPDFKSARGVDTSKFGKKIFS